MEPSSHRPVPRKVRRYVLWENLSLIIVALVLLWGIYAAKALFDFDVAPKREGPPGATESLYLVLGLVGTPLIVGIGWWRIRRNLRLYRVGVEITGRISSVGTVGAQLVTIRYQFEHDGRWYSGAFSGMPEFYAVDDPIEVLADPRNPERNMHLDEYLVDLRDEEGDESQTPRNGMG